MAISVFTPSHNPQYLDACYLSLKNQTYTDWEWIIVPNGPAYNEVMNNYNDSRVYIHPCSGTHGVGYLKATAVDICNHEILVELDHDDTLMPTCLEEIWSAFNVACGPALVYTDYAQMNEDGSRNDERFDPAMGWEYINWGDYLQCRSMGPSPHNVSYIWYGPHHCRAFSRAHYDKAGGYNRELDILDDQDLISRLYQTGEFVHIPKMLYLQRIHDNNTWKQPQNNERIQRETVAMYDKYIEDNAIAWSRRQGLLTLDLGAAHNHKSGYIGVDIVPAQGVQLVSEATDLDLPDSSIGVIRAVDFLEHVRDKVKLFNEMHRLLAHGGMLLSLTPSTDGRGAYQDPTHVSYYNENSFWYYTDKNYAKYVPGLTAKFQVSRLVTYYPSDWHKLHNIFYVCANLIAIKDGPRQGGQSGWE